MTELREYVSREGQRYEVTKCVKRSPGLHSNEVGEQNDAPIIFLRAKGITQSRPHP